MLRARVLGVQDSAIHNMKALSLTQGGGPRSQRVQVELLEFGMETFMEGLTGHSLSSNFCHHVYGLESTVAVSKATREIIRSNAAKLTSKEEL